MEVKEIKTVDIELAIIKKFNPRQNLVVPNVSWGMNMHECDMLIITSSGYGIEIEIKVSKSDLIADKKKRHGHYDDRIRKLYFAVPENLESFIEWIPVEAGIFVIREHINKDNEKNIYCEKIREAQIKSNYKFSAGEYSQVARLGAMRIWLLKRKIQELKKGKFEALEEN